MRLADTGPEELEEDMDDRVGFPEDVQMRGA